MRKLTRRLARVHLLLALWLGWLLLWVLLSGSLSFYRAELDRWQHPVLAAQQGPLPAAELSAQQALRYLAQQAPMATQWYVQLASARQPYLTLHWQLPAAAVANDNSGRFRSGPFYQQWLAADGSVALAPPQQVKAGDHRHQLGGLFFQLHYSLLQAAGLYSRSLVAYLALLWLLLSLTGLYSLRGRFASLWQWRLTGLAAGRKKQLRHQQLAVLTLPFAVLFACTGWLTQILSENPAPLQQLYPQGTAEFYQQLFPQPARLPTVQLQAAQALTAAQRQQLLIEALPGLMQQARLDWQGKSVGKLNLSQPLQAEMQLTLQSAAADRTGNKPDSQSFMLGAMAGLAVTPDWQQLPVASNASTLPVAQSRDFWYGVHQSLFWPQTMRLLLLCAGLGSSWMLWLGVRSWLQRQTGFYLPALLGSGFLAVPSAMLLLMLWVPLANRLSPTLLASCSLPQWLALAWGLAFGGWLWRYRRQCIAAAPLTARRWSR